MNSLFTPTNDDDALPEVEAGAGEKSVLAFALAVLEKVASLLERRRVDVSGCGACCCFGVVDGRSAVLAGLIFDCERSVPRGGVISLQVDAAAAAHAPHKITHHDWPSFLLYASLLSSSSCLLWVGADDQVLSREPPECPAGRVQRELKTSVGGLWVCR